MAMTISACVESQKAEARSQGEDGHVEPASLETQVSAGERRCSTSC